MNPEPRGGGLGCRAYRILSLGASHSGGRAAPADRGPRPEQEAGWDATSLPEIPRNTHTGYKGHLDLGQTRTEHLTAAHGLPTTQTTPAVLGISAF